VLDVMFFGYALHTASGFSTGCAVASVPEHYLDITTGRNPPIPQK
jgi:hypothetical protein